MRIDTATLLALVKNNEKASAAVRDSQPSPDLDILVKVDLTDLNGVETATFYISEYNKYTEQFGGIMHTHDEAGGIVKHDFLHPFDIQGMYAVANVDNSFEAYYTVNELFEKLKYEQE